MKVAKLYSFNDIRIEDILVPEVGPNEAIIKTKACGICSGDVMPWYIERKAPLVPGHEPAGEIVECRTPNFKIGDRVFVHHHAPCMNCRYCSRGDYVQCQTWKDTRIIPGGISEYILIPETNLRNDTLLIPEGMDYEDATLIEPTACVDKENTEIIEQIILRMKREGRSTVIITTHDREQAERLADRILAIDDGRIIEKV